MKNESHAKEAGNPYDRTDSEGVDDSAFPSEFVDGLNDLCAEPISAVPRTQRPANNSSRGIDPRRPFTSPSCLDAFELGEAVVAAGTVMSPCDVGAGKSSQHCTR